MTSTRQNQTALYVSPDGDDANPGTEAAPLATLDAARDALRDRSHERAGPVTVCLRGGTYRRTDPLVLGPEDGGTARRPVTYTNYPGERPTLSGGRLVDGAWEHHGDGVYVCDVGDVDGEFDQLFVDGERQVRARYPDADAGPDGGAYLHATGADEYPHDELHFDPEAFPDERWADPEGAVVHCFNKHDWGNLQYRVADVDWSNGVLHLQAGGWQFNDVAQGANNGIDERSRFYVENVFEELDAPREWYLDADAGRLYYQPPDGVDPNEATVELAGTDRLIEVRGSRERPVRHLELSGLVFTATGATYLEPYDVPSMGDWAIHRGGAVYLTGSERCSVRGNHFDAVGGNAVFLDGHNRSVRVAGNAVTDAGDSGVCLVGASHLDTDGSYACPHCGHEHDWGWDEPRDAYPAHCEVTDNYVARIGRFGKQTAGVFHALGAHNTVSHNEIHTVPRAGICFNDGCWGGHDVGYNDVSDTVRETGDHGPFNAWGRGEHWCLAQSHGDASHPSGDVLDEAAFTTAVHHNHFRDDEGWGIDLDDGASNYHVHHNLCVGVSVKLREGDHRTVEDNVFFHPANPPGIHVGYEDTDDRFRRNVVAMHSGAESRSLDVDFDPDHGAGECLQLIRPPARGDWLGACDANLYWTDADDFAVGVSDPSDDGGYERLSLDEWRARGYDEHAVVADPEFRSPDAGDFRVAEASPARDVGVEGVPRDFIDRVGPRDCLPDWVRRRVGSAADDGATGRR